MNFSMLAFSDLFGDIENYFANFETAADSCRTIMLWLAIALVIAFIAVKVAFYFTAPKPVQGEVVADKRQKIANKVGLFVALAYVVTAIVAFSAFYFADVNAGEDYLVPITFYPLLVFAIVAIAGGIAVAFKPVKPVKIAALSLGGAALVAAIVCLIVYYATGDAGDWNGVTLDGATDAGLYISAIALTAIIIVVSFITDKTKGFDTRAITFAAISIALSFALSYIRILHMPMGGSITFASMLPLMLYSYMFGCKKGLIAGIVYGFLQAIQDPWLLHPAQFALDYLVAFMAMALTGCLRNVASLKGKMRTQFTLGAIIAGVMRYISHYFSGVFAFGTFGADYAEEYGISALANPYFYSFVYQSMYVIPEIVIVIVVGVILLSSANFRKQVLRYGNFEKTIVSVHTEEIPAAGNAQ
ncbi:MAG TPA: energy-coupled thiamine transporter ThiT [Candidatus Coproplasma stercoravium]|nr:energy-coupled thiamine transporter ThiT [Candidatus Coproplasma stercoravium]